jgi:predicted nucleic acid-binding protein
MKILFDLNILLDVVQHRKPHFSASAKACASAVRKEITAFVPAHAVTTLAYITRKHAGPQQEAEVIDWLLAHFTIAKTGHSEVLRARALRMSDFEDAVVVATAEASQCLYILTRNITDFEKSPVPALTPEEFLSRHSFLSPVL